MSKKEPYSFSHVAQELIGDLRGISFNEPKRMKRRPTHELTELISDILAKHHVGKHTPEDSLRERWADIVGHANAVYSHPVSIDEKGRLLVLVSHSMVKSNLSMDMVRILPAVKAVPGCGQIRSIQLRTG